MLTDRLGGRDGLARLVTLLVVVGLAAPAGVSAVTPQSGGTPGQVGLEPGTVTEPADNATVVGIQGFHFQGQGAEKKPARVVSAGPGGETNWAFEGGSYDATWFYDVDPLPNGNLLVVSTNPDGTLVMELDRSTREAVWQERFDMTDTHDVDMLPNGNLVIANMRNWDEERGVSDDRIVIYDRETEEFVWEWTFRNHYDNATDGGFSEDWTHVNDVDRVGDGRFLLSPRNFDQAIVVDRESKAIVERLGTDGDHDTMFEQHNPDWLVSEAGNPTILVADSENDRIVEYTKRDGEWEQIWTVGAGQLSWPRDADRLPNGNTLITDSLNHRVIEVTPQGEIVWEYYATWGAYEAERLGTGDESNGPTMTDQGVSGNYSLTGSAGLIEGTGDTNTFAATVQNSFAGTPLAGAAEEFAVTWSHVTPWVQPVWMDSWSFASLAGGLVVALGWGLTELVAARRRIVGAVRGVAG
ncbi:MAG: WD40 repeat protein [halophilic archaeon J07HB67]|jgi:Arylsulfotransferase (ASST).|nr:MAG: WD40 repeat protein [halophilic archaeon J07HB67]